MGEVLEINEYLDAKEERLGMGSILLFRSIMQTEAWRHPNSDYLKVLVWCYLAAMENKGYCYFNRGNGYIEVKCKRGQFPTGRNHAEEETGISASTCGRILEWLADRKYIKMEKVDNQYSMVTVCNYGFFQDQLNLVERPKNSLRVSAEDITEVIEYLNKKSGKSFRTTTESIRDQIKARMRDGFSVEDCKIAIDWCVGKWLNDPKMKQFVRVSTIFTKGKFPDYVANGENQKKQSAPSELGITGEYV